VHLYITEKKKKINVYYNVQMDITIILKVMFVHLVILVAKHARIFLPKIVILVLCHWVFLSINVLIIVQKDMEMLMLCVKNVLLIVTHALAVPLINVLIVQLGFTF
jgi:hypothetical protein